MNIDIVKIAKLAHLILSSQDQAMFSSQFGALLDFVGKLQDLDTKDISPTSQVTGLVNVFREDEIIPSLSQKEALANAKKVQSGFFVVPAVL